MDIVNISFGGEMPSQIYVGKVQEAYNAGILIIASIGNDDYMGDDTVLYPARHSSATAVGAVDSKNERAFFFAMRPSLEQVAPA